MTTAYHRAQIRAAGVVLEADITIPQPARAMVLFVHGGGSSSRFSPRNRYVAQQFRQAGLATVLAGLLTPAEENRCPHRGDPIRHPPADHQAHATDRLACRSGAHH